MLFACLLEGFGVLGFFAFIATEFDLGEMVGHHLRASYRGRGSLLLLRHLPLGRSGVLLLACLLDGLGILGFL